MKLNKDKEKHVQMIKKAKTKTKVKTNNAFLKIITQIGTFFAVEIYMFIKSLGLGVFTFFDRLVTYSFSLFSYIFFGIGNFLKVIWKYFFGKIFREIKLFFKAIFEGVVFVLNEVFYEFPKYLINKISGFTYNIFSKLRRGVKNFKEDTASMPDRIKKYFISKFDSLPVVERQRQKRESELVLLDIDKQGDDAKRSEIKQTYRYTARNKEGKVIKGYFAALSKLDVYSYLLDEGYQVYEIDTNWWVNFVRGESRTLRRKMNNKDLIFWLAQLSTYIKSGIPLTESVKILAKQDKRRKYKAIYDSMIYELTMGESFSESLRKQGSVFPALLINMIKAAELIGDIESTLDEMSEYYKEVEQTRKSMISALMYPSIILVFSVAVVTFIMVFIIPKFVDVYASMDTELNPMTVVVLNISDYLQLNGIRIIVTIVAAIIVIRLLYKNVKAFRSFMQYLIMHIPVLGKIIIYKELSLFSKTFSTLNKNNIMLTDSIDILSKITNNEIFKSIMFHTIANLLKGEKMSDSFKSHWAIPELAYYMITTGENTGELAEMLEKVSDFYQDQQKNMVSTIKTFIEPIMIAFLAIIVGMIILAIIIPMFGLYQSIT